MSTLYISPAGTGDGSSIKTAGSINDLENFISLAGPGGQVLLIADQGDYNLPLTFIRTGGADGAPVTIRGVDSAGNSMQAHMVGSGNEGFRLLNGADNLVFEDMSFSHFGDGVFRLGADAKNITIQDVHAEDVYRFVENYISGENTTASIDGLTIRNVDVVGYDKGAIRLQYDTRNVLIENVHGDGGNRTGEQYVNGVDLDGTVHDVVIRNSTMENNYGTGTADFYWNGDGFTTELGTYNIRFENTMARNNTDGGYDLKSTDTTLINAQAEDNFRNFRIWTDATFENPTGGNLKQFGGTSHEVMVWVGENGKVIMNGGTLSDTDPDVTVFFELKAGSTLTLNGTVVNKAEGVPLQSDSGTLVVVSPACFCRGTRIRTPEGEVAVEGLRIGDLVTTASGNARRVRWIGRRAYDGRFIAGNKAALPIRIAAGALADGVPDRDLWVSPEHAMVIDGFFLPARTLVNGITILKVARVDQLEYFHVELDSHDVIFAEGAAAETYADCDNRMSFANAHEFAALYPHAGQADWEDYYQPLLERGRERLPAIRTALLARAEQLGLGTYDPDLHLLVDGAVVRADAIDGGIYRFRLPESARSVTLASRTAIPTQAEVASLDLRQLGVPFERAILIGAGVRIEIAQDCPLLGDGFHRDEGLHRWTDGAARLPTEIFSCCVGKLSLAVQIGKTRLLYAIDGGTSRVTVPGNPQPVAPGRLATGCFATLSAPRNDSIGAHRLSAPSTAGKGRKRNFGPRRSGDASALEDSASVFC